MPPAASNSPLLSTTVFPLINGTTDTCLLLPETGKNSPMVQSRETMSSYQQESITRAVFFFRTTLLSCTSTSPDNTSAIASEYATCSCSRILAESVGTSSPSRTGTVFCKMMGPWSRCSSTKCTVQPVTLTP